MIKTRFIFLSRAGFALLVLISGVAMIPFTGLSPQQLNWRQFAAVYQPDVNVNHNRGASGSAFLFTGSGFPPNAVIMVYRDGAPLGTIASDGAGQVEALIQTHSFNAEGRYFITLAADDNNAATKDFDLDNNEPLWPPPGDYNGEVLDLTQVSRTFLPVVIRQ